MSPSRKLGVALLTVTVAFCSLEFGEHIGVPGVQGFISQAEARVGRPLTPVSVAGAARRTVRRCATGVYYC